MKKWIAGILTLVMLMQALPWTAFAAGSAGDMISQSELQRALLLAGLKTNAGGDGSLIPKGASGVLEVEAKASGYHDGMTPQETWDAQLLVDWLEDELSLEIYNATNVFTRACTLLEKLETEDPSAYALIMNSTPDSMAYAQTCRDWMLNTEALEEEARYYRTRVNENVATIEMNTETLANEADGLFDYEKARLSEQIREASSALIALRDDIIEFCQIELEVIKTAQKIIDGDKNSDFSEWLKDLLEAEEGPQMTTVSSSTIRKGATNTLLSRLGANDSVLPKGDTQDTKITVISENEFVIIIKGKENKPLADVSVTVKDLKGKAVKTVKTNKDDGMAKFNANDFVSNYDKEMELSMEVDASAAGYRSFSIPWFILKRGGHRDEYLTPLAKPYIRSATFNGYDIMRQDKTTYISKINDAKVNFEVVVEHDAGKSVKPPVLHYWKNQPSGGDIAPKEQTMEPTSSEKVSDTQTKYIWKGTWRRDLSPDVKKDQKPYFVMPDNGEVFKTKLTPLSSYIDEPTDSMLPSSVVKKFGLNFTVPVIGGNLGLDIPVDKYLPKIAVNPEGYVTVTMGTSLADPKWPTEWKNKEKETYDRVMKDYEHTYKLADRMSQLGNAKQYYKSGKVQGSAKFDFGVYQMLSGRFTKSAEDKAILWAADGVFGFNFTFNADFTKPFTIGPVPFYLNINFSATAGFAFEGMKLSFMTTQKREFKNFKFDFLNGITIDVRLAVTATFGLGIKGLLSAWVSATGAINVIVQLRRSDPTRVAVYLEASIAVGFEILWIKYSKTLYTTPKIKLYANYDVDRDPLKKAFNLFAAYAEESSTGEKKVELVPEEPDNYPALAPTATPVIQGEENSRADIKVVTYGSYTYVFYLGTVKGRDGKDHRRLCWLELKTRKTGNMQSNLPDKVASLDDYDFDVFRTNGAVSLDLIYVIVLCGRNFDEKTGLPKVSYDDNENNVNTYYYVTRLDPDASYETPGTLYVRGIGDAPWLAKEKDKRYPLIANPRIDSVNIWSGGNDYLYGTLDGFGEDGKKLGYNVFSVSAVNRRYDVFSKDTSVKGPWKDNQSYQRIAIRSNYKSSDSIGNGGNYKNPILAWVGLSGPTGDGKGDNYLELFDFDMNSAKTPKSYTLDAGDIGAFEMIQTLNPDSHKVATQTVYYTKAQTVGAIKEYRLKSVTLTNKTGKQNDYKFDANYVDYDLSIPVTDFHTAIIDKNLYLYWISAEAKKKEGDPDVWRVNAVYLDPKSNAISDQLVLAEFTLKDIEWKGKKHRAVPYQVRLTDANTGYITAKPDTGDEKDRSVAPTTLYRFPIKLMPSLDMKKAALMETTVVQGDFVTTDISLMNAGNMGVTGFDIELWQLENGKETKKIETLHADCLEPAKSTLTMYDDKGGSSVVAQGDKAFFRYNDFNFSSRQREWNVRQNPRTVTVKNGSEFSDGFGNQKTNKVATNVLVPGALGSFNGSIKIPASWAGKYDLRLKLVNVSTYTNWVGAIAKSAVEPKLFAKGDQAVLDDIGGEKLVYQLDEASGMLVLQRDLMPKDGDEETVLLYPEVIEAPKSIDIDCNVHDLDVGHRLYQDSYGDEMLDIILNNYYHNDETIELTCAVYVNDAETPYYVSLPYDPKSVAAGKTTTISLPLAVLVDPETTESARFVINPRGIDETAQVNNEFTIYPGGTSALTVVEDPVSTAVRPGGSASFTVGVYGGEGNYTYQWQVFVDGKWQNIPGATGAVLNLDKVKPEWNGRRTRCIIADGGREIRVDDNGNPIIPAGEEGHYVVSGEAVLTVIGGGSGIIDGDGDGDEHPDTGDHANLPLYLAVALIAIGLLILMRRRRAN